MVMGVSAATTPHPWELFLVVPFKSLIKVRNDGVSKKVPIL
jgi:hypothetical protein